MDIVQSLSQALEACPFTHLGWQQQDSAKLIRAWLPGATKVTVTKLKDRSKIGDMLIISREGLFEMKWPDDIGACAYRFHVTREDTEFELTDPYQFSQLTFTDSHYDGNHLHHNLGAHLCSETDADGNKISGVRFAVYAPNARTVSVIGNFNDWDGRRNPMHSSSDGIWRLFMPDLTAGDLYKFEIKQSDGKKLPLKSDPFGYFHEQYPSFASVVYDHSQYQWQDKSWREKPVPDWRKEPMTMYELHAGSWRTRDGRPLNWEELADELIPYMEYMGYTHIELMPVAEYPFDGSWGYQPVGLFAPTSRFGTPDQFKLFVDRCHQAGLGVVVDWVPAHFPSDPHGITRFDGSNLFEYEDPRKGWHPDWNSHIYDYGKSNVCDFLISSAVAWAELFHIDGIRVDAVASMLYLDYSREGGEWVPNVDGGNTNYEAVNFLKRLNETLYHLFPGIVTIAEESTSYPGVTTPVYMGGLGFGFKWNMGWMHDSLEYIKEDPVHRSYHHNEITFSTVYSFSENFVLPLSHDEVVHGKGSIMSRMPGDEWQRFANLRAYYSFMYCHPGKKLNFMGNEYAQHDEWNHRHSLDWHLAGFEPHQGVQRMIKDLNNLYRTEPAMHYFDCESQGFYWINHNDSQHSVLSFVRRANDDLKCLLILTNFTPVTHEHYCVGAPLAGKYEVIMNTDAAVYGGSDVETGHIIEATNHHCDGQPYQLGLRIPPLATIILKKI